MSTYMLDNVQFRSSKNIDIVELWCTSDLVADVLNMN